MSKANKYTFHLFEELPEVNIDKPDCPVCGEDLSEERDGKTYMPHLMSIENPMIYDGAIQYQCLKCKVLWNRFDHDDYRTKELINSFDDEDYPVHVITTHKDGSESKITECDLCHNETLCHSYFKADFWLEIEKALGLEGRYGNFFCKHSCWNIIERLSKLNIDVH